MNYWISGVALIFTHSHVGFGENGPFKGGLFLLVGGFKHFLFSIIYGNNHPN